jgi:serine/threonine-protein kinase
MPAKVVITIIQGDDAGKELIFTEPAECIGGRSKECSLVIHEHGEAGKYISRQHFLLKINPPDVRIQDLGSRSGTYLRSRARNGAPEFLLGKRRTREPQTAADKPRDYPLYDGDEIRIHTTVLRISLRLPMVCRQCGREESPSDSLIFAADNHGYLCTRCAKFLESHELTQPEEHENPRCARCGHDVSSEIGRSVSGQYVCEACRTEPEKALQTTFETEQRGRFRLNAIQGLKIVKELGRGRSGCVCLAEDIRTGEYVAVKILMPQKVMTFEELVTFKFEIENTKALRHENIVTLFDCGRSRGSFFFTSEFCDARSVDRLISSSPFLPVDQALDIAFQALDGLDYAHHAEIPNVRLIDGSTESVNGLVHRDIKPENLFLKRMGGKLIVKIGDFGLSKAFEVAGLSGNTRTGDARGTPEYMCRRQATKYKYAGPEVDVWALAASLYTMLTGYFVRDFDPDNENRWETLATRPIVPIRERKSDLPNRLAETIDVALCDDEDLHFQSALEFKQALLDVT